jgi:hypothetical protein
MPLSGCAMTKRYTSLKHLEHLMAEISGFCCHQGANKPCLSLLTAGDEAYEQQMCSMI